MSELKAIIKAHFIFDNELVYAKQIHHAPMIGDELRFPDDMFFVVTRLVWIYDEDDQLMSRLNIGIDEVKEHD